MGHHALPRAAHTAGTADPPVQFGHHRTTSPAAASIRRTGSSIKSLLNRLETGYYVMVHKARAQSTRTRTGHHLASKACVRRAPVMRGAVPLI